MLTAKFSDKQTLTIESCREEYDSGRKMCFLNLVLTNDFTGGVRDLEEALTPEVCASIKIYEGTTLKQTYTKYPMVDRISFEFDNYGISRKYLTLREASPAKA